MKLSKDEKKQLFKIILDSYPDIADLKMLIEFELDETLDNIVAGDKNKQIVFNLIKWAESTGKLENLLEAISQDLPDNLALQEIIKQLLAKINEIKWKNLLEKENLTYFHNLIQEIQKFLDKKIELNKRDQVIQIFENLSSNLKPAEDSIKEVWENLKSEIQNIDIYLGNIVQKFYQQEIDKLISQPIKIIIDIEKDKEINDIDKKIQKIPIWIGIVTVIIIIIKGCFVPIIPTEKEITIPLENIGIPSGWTGEGKNIQDYMKNCSTNDKDCFDGSDCFKFWYKKGNGYGGIFWFPPNCSKTGIQTPLENAIAGTCGLNLLEQYNLKQVKSVIFYAKSEQDDLTIVFQVGDLQDQILPIRGKKIQESLTQQWTQYSIDNLDTLDFSKTIALFYWYISDDFFPSSELESVTFLIDNITFKGISAETESKSVVNILLEKLQNH